MYIVRRPLFFWGGSVQCTPASHGLWGRNVQCTPAFFIRTGIYGFAARMAAGAYNYDSCNNIHQLNFYIMKQLKSLYFHFLPLAAHFDFFKKLLALLLAAGTAVKAALEALMPDFNAWLDKEDALMRWVRKSVLTEKIAETDREMDFELAGINAALRAIIYGHNEQTVSAATRLLTMVQSYGRIMAEAYDEEAGDVRAMLEQFNGPYYNDVGTAGIAYRVAMLQDAFTRFEKLLTQREAEQGVKPPYTSREVRKGMEGVYHQIANIINANATVGTSDDFDALIALLNPDIDRLNSEFHRAKKDLSVGDHTVIEPISTQAYTGKAITPITKVYYREDNKPTVELVFAKDFSVTYKNNVNVGMAAQQGRLQRDEEHDVHDCTVIMNYELWIMNVGADLCVCPNQGRTHRFAPTNKSTINNEQ